MSRILQALDRQFGAYQVLGPVQGSWQGQRQQCISFKIAIPRAGIRNLKTLVLAIGQELGEEAMYFEQCGRAELLKVPKKKKRRKDDNQELLF